MKKFLLYLSLGCLVATGLLSLYALGLTWKMPFATKTLGVTTIAVILFYLNALVQPRKIGEKRFDFDIPIWFYKNLSYLIAVGLILVPLAISESITWLFKAYFTTMSALIIVGQIAFFQEWKAMFTGKIRQHDDFGW